MIIERLKTEAESIASWLETNRNHERFAEGFEKLRELYKKISAEYIKGDKNE